MTKKNTDQLRKLYVRDQRLRNRNERLNTLNRLAFCLLVIALCAILPVTALPSLEEADKLEETFQTEWQAKLKEATEAKDNAEREYRALQQDPRFLEIKARERLKWSKPGERILVFPEDSGEE
jgi:cell division protein FtsB